MTQHSQMWVEASRVQPSPSSPAVSMYMAHKHSASPGTFGSLSRRVGGMIGMWGRLSINTGLDVSCGLP